MEKFKKKYQIWVKGDYNHYSPYEYDTLKECLLHERYGSNFYITQKVEFKVEEVLVPQGN